MIRVSIIIATYNRGRSLVRTLGSVVRQSLGAEAWECVVVDNNSSDDTQELFASFAAAHPDFNMRIVRETAQGLSHARNRGIAESAGEYIAIIDDDEEVNAGFARAYLDFFDSYPDAVAGGGKITPLYEFKTPEWLSPITERPIAGTLDMGGAIVPFRGERYPGGGNMALRRSAVERYGMFNPDLGRTGKKLLAGEEKDLFRRLKAGGEKIYYVPGAQILHIIPESRLTREYFARATRMVGVSERIRTQGISASAYMKRLLGEAVKWCGTVVYALGYLLRLQPAKAGGLFTLRRNITLGLLGFPPKQQ